VQGDVSVLTRVKFQLIKWIYSSIVKPVCVVYAYIYEKHELCVLYTFGFQVGFEVSWSSSPVNGAY